MKHTYLERLDKLISCLEKHKENPHILFDFSLCRTINILDKLSQNHHSLWGYLPKAFPTHFSLIRNGDSLIILFYGNAATREDIMTFLGLSERSYTHIFLPRCQVESMGKLLDDEATIDDVIKNLIKYRNLYEIINII